MQQSSGASCPWMGGYRVSAAFGGHDLLTPPVLGCVLCLDVSAAFGTPDQLLGGTKSPPVQRICPVNPETLEPLNHKNP